MSSTPQRIARLTAGVFFAAWLPALEQSKLGVAVLAFAAPAARQVRSVKLIDFIISSVTPRILVASVWGRWYTMQAPGLDYSAAADWLHRKIRSPTKRCLSLEEGRPAAPSVKQKLPRRESLAVFCVQQDPTCMSAIRNEADLRQCELLRPLWVVCRQWAARPAGFNLRRG